MNSQKEIRRGYEILPEMKKVWSVEIELLRKLLDVCKRYNLKIFAEGGTLLGAIREHGFIPWDDDIDMAMPREDYDKLRELASAEFKSPYFFQCGYTDIFPNGITRLRKDGTAAITYKSIYDRCHQGIFIDIFPLDSIPDEKSECERFVKEIVKSSKIKLINHHHFSFSNVIYNYEILKIHYRIKKKGFNYYFSKFDELVKSYYKEKCSKVSIISWSVDPKYVREKGWYDNTLFLPFEDIIIPVPSSYDQILSKQYGDYMKPTKAPTEHGGVIVLDSEHSYLDYLPRLRKEHRLDSWKNRCFLLKKLFKKLL